MRPFFYGSLNTMFLGRFIRLVKLFYLIHCTREKYSEINIETFIFFKKKFHSRISIPIISFSSLKSKIISAPL